jgi:hypothetical protein
MDNAEWVAGNKYRLHCRECGRWLPCCSERDWKTHDDPRVLPADCDPDDPELVPVEQTDYSDRIESNFFRCPSEGCEATHNGYPDECGACGVSYNW